MRTRTKLLCRIAAVLFIAALSTQTSLYAQDPTIRDTVFVDSIVSSVTGKGYIPISFYNDERLAGLEVTLTFSSTDLIVDSFSFIGGRIGGLALKGSTSTAANSVTIYGAVMDEPLVSSGTGLLGHLYVSFASGAAPQLISIDSINTLVDGEKQYATRFSDATANRFAPVFVRGFVNLQESCCLDGRGNIDGSIDGEINIADLVYMVAYMFAGGPVPPCLEEADVDATNDPNLNIADLVYLVSFMFSQGPAPLSCY